MSFQDPISISFVAQPPFLFNLAALEASLCWTYCITCQTPSIFLLKPVAFFVLGDGWSRLNPGSHVHPTSSIVTFMMRIVHSVLTFASHLAVPRKKPLTEMLRFLSKS